MVALTLSSPISPTANGTTACAWDSIVPLAPMWEQFKRVIKPRGAIVLFGSQPFTSVLITSNLQWFKYSLVWEKTVSANFFNAKNKPLVKHEDICIFSEGTTANGSERNMIYNPQGLVQVDKEWHRPRKYGSAHKFDRESHSLTRTIEFSGYPGSILKYSNANNESVHPTQKPVNLLAYLIRTYTNPGETVLDCCFGSGTTGVACMETGRNFVGVEKDSHYFALGKQRIEDAHRAVQGLPKELRGKDSDIADMPLFAEVVDIGD